MKRTLLRALLMAAALVASLAALAAAETLTQGVLTDAVISTGGETLIYTFTPDESGWYAFTSSGSCDTVATLYDYRGDALKSGDDFGSDRNSRLVYRLYSYSTYTYEVRLYSGSATGSFQVAVGPTRGLYSASQSKSDVYVYPGSTPTLAVNAEYDGGVTYRWSYRSMNDFSNEPAEIPGASQSAYTTEPVLEDTYYYCAITDECERTKTLQFYVYCDNELEAQAQGNTSFQAALGTVSALSVSASCHTGDLTYTWYKRIYEEGMEGEEGWTVFAGPSNTKTSIQTDPLATRTDYRCLVEDEYDDNTQVYFTIIVKNDLTVTPVGGSLKKFAPGDTVLLSVSADCRTGALHYEWRGFTYMSDGNRDYFDAECDASTLRLENVTNRFEVYCYVSDDYGNRAEATFVGEPDNDLRVAYGTSPSITAHPGETPTLAVNSFCAQGALAYTWLSDARRYYYSYNNEDYWDGSEIEGETSSSLTLGENMKTGTYVCIVRDMYGNEIYRPFAVTVDNSLSVSALNPSRQVAQGTDVPLSVSASASSGVLKYSWSGRDITPNGSACTASDVQEDTTVKCTVSDDYGNSREVSFVIRVTAIETLPAATNVTVQLPEDGSKTFSFTAASTGLYSFRSIRQAGQCDPRATLYDEYWRVLEKNEYDGMDYSMDFLITRRLTAGQTVYLNVSEYYGAPFIVRAQLLDQVFAFGGETLCLPKGLQFMLPVEDSGVFAFVNKAPDTLDIDGNVVSVMDTGGAVMYAITPDSYIIYDFDFSDRLAVLDMPAGLETIGAEAFLNTGACYAALYERVKTVKTNAFKGMDLDAVFVYGLNTTFEDGALGDSEPVIVCREGSAAAQWARQKGLAYLYIYQWNGEGL